MNNLAGLLFCLRAATCFSPARQLFPVSSCCHLAATTSNAARANQFCVFVDNTAGAPKYSGHVHILTCSESYLQEHLHFFTPIYTFHRCRSFFPRREIAVCAEKGVFSEAAPTHLALTSFVLACITPEQSDGHRQCYLIRRLLDECSMSWREGIFPFSDECVTKRHVPRK